MDRNWSKTIRCLALILALVGIIWFPLAARILIGPLVIAALLAYALYPAVTFLPVRAKLGRNLLVP